MINRRYGNAMDDFVLAVLTVQYVFLLIDFLKQTTNKLNLITQNTPFVFLFYMMALNL